MYSARTRSVFTIRVYAIRFFVHAYHDEYLIFTKQIRAPRSFFSIISVPSFIFRINRVHFQPWRKWEKGQRSMAGLNSLEDTFEIELSDEIPKATSKKHVMRWTFFNGDNFAIVTLRVGENSDSELSRGSERPGLLGIMTSICCYHTSIETNAIDNFSSVDGKIYFKREFST